MFMRSIGVLLLLLLLLVSFARAELPRAVFEDKFESVEAGISYRIPIDAVETGRSHEEQIARYTLDEKAEWVLTVDRFILKDPIPLVQDEKADSVFARGGFLELSASTMPIDDEKSILRVEMIPIAGQPGAQIVSRFTTVEGDKRIQQRAIIRRADRLYYVISLTSPVSAFNDLENDPAAIRAVDIFTRLIDSVQMLDQTKLRIEQDERLFRTRTLFVNWTRPKITAAIVPERWLRVQQNGKDVGYIYEVAELANDIPRAGRSSGLADSDQKALGVRVGLRSRFFNADGSRLDSESWMWVGFDKKQESFSHTTVVTRKDESQTYASEVGVTTSSMKTVPIVSRAPGEIRDSIELVRREIYELLVIYQVKNEGRPDYKQELPPYYVPQALAYLMPRLVPLLEPKGYLVATYEPNRKSVMTRYVDVLEPQFATFAGKRQPAIAVEERVGLAGQPTTHYFTPAGEYLATTIAATNTTILPTTQAEILAIWKDANLTRPADVNDSTTKELAPAGR